MSLIVPHTAQVPIKNFSISAKSKLYVDIGFFYSSHEHIVLLSAKYTYVNTRVDYITVSYKFTFWVILWYSRSLESFIKATLHTFI